MIPMDTRVRICTEQLRVREGLQNIEPPEEAERARKIYDLVRSLGEAHWFAVFYGVLCGVGGAVAAATMIFGPWLDGKVVPGVANALGMDPKNVAFFGGMVTAGLGALIGLLTICPLYLKWKKPHIWAELDDLLALPGTPGLLEQIAEVDPRFHEAIPALLKTAVTN